MFRASLRFLLMFAMVGFFSVEVVAEEGPAESTAEKRTPNWTVTVDPLTTALGFSHIQIERRISNNWSIYTGPHLRLFDSIFEDEEQPYRGYGAEVGMRWFPLGGAPGGLWLLGRGVGARTMTLENIDPTTGWGGYASGLIGYTWLPVSWLALSGGAGVQYLRYGVEEYGTEGILPALHTAVGIAF